MTKLEKEAEEYFKSICEDYNEEYERTGKRHYFVGFDIKNAYLASAESRKNQITELKKENKRLKLLIRTEHKIGNDEFWKSVWVCKKQVDDLSAENAKAKEMIKYLLSITNENGLKICDVYGNPEMIKKVEDFIKGVGND